MKNLLLNTHTRGSSIGQKELIRLVVDQEKWRQRLKKQSFLFASLIKKGGRRKKEEGSEH